MLLIYIPVITSRHRYVFDFLLSEVLQTTAELTNSFARFKEYAGSKMAYASEEIEEGVYVQACGLLEEQGIIPQQVGKVEFNGGVGLFPVDKGALPFDVFAASFYLLSRYEEYLPFTPDQHGRFEAGQSMATRYNFLHLPLIDLWAFHLKELLLQHFPGLLFKQRQYQFQPTLDIDNAFAYRHKGVLRTLAAAAFFAAKLQWRELQQRWLVLRGQQADPFDTYQKQEQLHQLYQLDPIYFILIGDYGSFDKNLSFLHPAFRDLIQQLSAKASIGIHPSYASNKEPGKLLKEISRLQAITGQEIVRSRQHYLKLHLPHTYRQLITAGIKEDYTMGYASTPGFRASTCTPFYFYDLEKEAITSLKVFPFVMMDTTCLHMKLRPEEVAPLMHPLIQRIKEVNGYCCVLFHNESLGGKGEWKGWEHMYEQIIRLSLQEERQTA